MSRLYFDQPLLFDFEAKIVGFDEWNGVPSVVLDQTAFYPEGGGQLADRGQLSGVAIQDVQIDDDERVHHLVDHIDWSVGALVSASIDPGRRRQHMSLHTAQHMLSRALLDRCAAQTISSRLGEQNCTVDVSVEGLKDSELYGVQDMVWGIIEEARPVHAYFPNKDELAGLNLRRAPKVIDNIRIVEIEGFDWTPCGGTHCTNTAQIGAFKITATERYKGMLRISFSSGRRAMEHFVRDAAILHDLATGFTCGPDQVPTAVEKIRTQLKASREQTARVREELAHLRVSALRASANGPHVVASWPGYTVEMLKTIAAALCEDPQVVACLISTDVDFSQVLVATNEQNSFDCGAFMKSLTQTTNGRGGGRANSAQGRFAAADDVERVVRALLSHA